MAKEHERYAAGQVGQKEYEQERARGKLRLRELLLIQRQETLPS